MGVGGGGQFPSDSFLTFRLLGFLQRRPGTSYLLGEVAGVHVVAVGLPPRTLDVDAVTLQDGCFFKNTKPLIDIDSTCTETFVSAPRDNTLIWDQTAHVPMLARLLMSLRRLANQL